MPSLDAQVVFLVLVALASVVQSLTAFAFGLVLLSLVELFRVIPLPLAANASMVLALVNSLTFLIQDGKPLLWREVRHTLYASCAGVAVGLAFGLWLSAGAAEWMRLLLGTAVILSAVKLLPRKRVSRERSQPRTFAFYGALSGLMGGLFATSGPPIVYHILRQPFDPLFARRCLVLIFAVNNALRLVLVVASGRLSQQSLLLSAIAMPITIAVSALCVRFPLRVSELSIRMATTLLLGGTGVALAVSATKHILLGSS
jgi:uncharacterized membrane protein YfcA